MDGILCIDKPAEMTSFLCCAILRRLLGVKKIGHAGTLDPNATGVLPLLIGRGTKALEHLPIHDKSYVARLRFGATSDTLDIWGNVTSTGKPAPTREALEEALGCFRGNILQIPPMTSALKKDGVRLYELARQGKEVEREPRPVTVYSLELTDYDRNAGEATIACTCSKGTYIRTLCDDLGRLLGCGGVMTALRRTMAAGYTEAMCITVDEARTLAEQGALSGRVLPVESAFLTYPALTVSDKQAIRFGNGGPLALERLKNRPSGTVRVLAPDGSFLGLGTPHGDELTILQLF